MMISFDIKIENNVDSDDEDDHDDDDGNSHRRDNDKSIKVLAENSTFCEFQMFDPMSC